MVRGYQLYRTIHQTKNGILTEFWLRTGLASVPTNHGIQQIVGLSIPRMGLFAQTWPRLIKSVRKLSTTGVVKSCWIEKSNKTKEFNRSVKCYILSFCEFWIWFFWISNFEISQNWIENQVSKLESGFSGRQDEVGCCHRVIDNNNACRAMFISL